MSLKSILVHIDDTQGAPARIEAAAALATAHDAVLTGLCVRPSVDVSYVAQTFAGRSLTDTLRKATDEIAERAKALFDRHAAAHPSRRWCEATGSVAEETIAQARYSDLIVVGPSDNDQPGSRRLSGQSVLGSGLPVLMVPERPAAPTLGRQVLIAWNASPESVRAIRAALPILKAAETVEVMIVVAGAPDPSDVSPGAPLLDYLAIQGISATVKLMTLDDVHGVAGAILARAGGIGADLVVMGAFGRSRLREAMIGSTTGKLLTNPGVPLFICH